MGEAFVIDEAAFPYGAKAILEQGDPYFYNGETRPRDLALWHPPLYVYSLALHMLFWGTSHFSVRLFGLLCVVFTLIIAGFILKNAIPLKKEWIVALNIFTLIFLFNPLLSESALVPDIDGTIAIPIIAGGFLHILNLVQKSWSINQFFWSVTFWLLIISTKFTLAILFIPIYFIATAMMRGRLAFNLLKSFSALLLGFLLFLALWFSFSKLSRIPFSPPFDYFKYSFSRKTGGSFNLQSLINSASSFDPRTLAWVGPFLIAIFLLISLFMLIKSFLMNNFDSFLLLSLFAIYTSLIYNSITGLPFTFPKYWVISILPICLVVAKFYASYFYNIDLSRFRNRYWILYLFNASLLTFLLSYILSKRNDINFGQSSYIFLQQNLGLSALVLLIILIPIARINFLEVSKNAVIRIVLFAIFSSLVISQFSTYALHRNADYSTSYYFGERGLDLTIDAIEDYIKKDELILAAKDIGIQSGRPFIEDAAVVNLSTVELTKFFSSSPISLVITRKKFDYSEPVYPDYFGVIQQLYVPILDNKDLDFIIWIPRPENNK
jgi:hypothetical protein